jgi:hypothetical protein
VPVMVKYTDERARQIAGKLQAIAAEIGVAR